jgi:ABC-type polysaccharide/polyol phosphate transport system ATPase subunit
MMARLGFSVATAWVPDIFIVDEVLGVGDAAFMQRSQERMREIRTSGATVVLVSHSNEAILKSCQRCVWLEKGRVRGDGPAQAVLTEYLQSVR